MNPRAKYLPEHWQKWVENHPKLSKGMLTEEFNGSVSLHWEDGSMAFFDYAFLVWDEDRDEICVFSEHCGYHCFTGTSSLTFANYTKKKIIRA
jgi:hypothetical protein